MVSQYPHTLTATVVTESHQDDNGNWVPGVEETKTFDCRSEPNGGGKMIQVADGSQIVFASTVYMPKGTASLPDQTQVTITWKGGGEFVSSGSVLLFSQGQLNCRLWL